MSVRIHSPRRTSLRPTQPVFLLLCVLLASTLHAQNTAPFFAGAQSTVTTTGLNAPAGVAVDASGNLFIADTGNNRIVKVTAAGVQSTVLSGTVLGKPLNAPNSIAVDSVDSIYITDSGNNRVLEVTAKGVASTLGSGFKDPSGIVAFYSGYPMSSYVFVADTGNNQVVQIYGGVQSALIPSTAKPGGIALSKPTGIVSFGSPFGEGVLYVADTGNNRVLHYDEAVGIYSYTSTLGSGLNKPVGVAGFSSGGTASRWGGYIADTGNGRVLSEIYNYDPANFPPFQVPVTTGIAEPGGMAMDSAGNLYIADMGNNRIVRLATAPAVDFGSVNLGSAGKTLDLNIAFPFQFDATGLEAVTLGAAKLDFQTTSAGNCKAQSYAAGSNCTVTVSMKPTAPGEREGALTFSNWPTTAYLRGMGAGPQIAYDPGIQTTLASGLSDPRGIAVDGSGNVYVADFGNGQIVKVTSAGLKSVLASIEEPMGLAMDGAGNLYFAISNTTAAGRVDLLTPAGVLSELNNSCCAWGLFEAPTGVSIDSSSNMYVVALGVPQVAMQSLADQSGAVTKVLAMDFLPNAVAADSSGNVYIVDITDWLVWKYTPAGDWSTVGSGYNRPQDVAVDQAGNVFVADFGNNQVVKVTPAGVQSTVGTGLSLPSAVAVDGAGNIYITDLGDGRLIKINRSTPPSLAFASTVVNKTSSDSPKEVTVENIGNLPLTFPVPSTGKNASLSPGFTMGSATTCPELSASSSPESLAAGSTCSYQVSFTPTLAGSISGSLVMTDNNANTAKATQTIHLSGTATAAAVKVNWAAPAPISAGTALSAKQLDASASVPGKFTYSPAAGAKPAKGTVKLTATFTPNNTAEYKTTTATVDLLVE